MRRSSTVSTWTKPAARMPRAWAVRNCFQVGPDRRGAGSIPAPCKICHTVEAATGWPSLTSSPLHPPVLPRRVVRGHADHELADRSRRGRSSGTPPAGVIPCACGQAPVPGQERRRGHREYLAPSARGDQPGQCRQPQPIARLVADGRSGGASPRSRAGAPGAQHPWTPHAGPAPSGRRAGSARAGSPSR